MRRALAALALALAGAACGVGAEDAPADRFAVAAAAYLVRIDGRSAWEQDAARRLPIASLAKLMTALIVAEAGRADEIVAVGREAAAETGSRVGLHAGDRMRASSLQAAMLIASANDACRALAHWIAGSERAFVLRMNRRAVELGLADTRFANACGHDHAGQYASAADLAKLADAALGEPRIAALVATRRQEIATEGGRRFRLETTNALLGRVPGVRGVKSGYTPKAGACVIAFAERDGVRVLVVLLGGHDRWWDAAALIERAFMRASRDAAKS